MRSALIIAAVWLALTLCARAEKLPPKPENHFNDYAGVVSTETARALNEKLAQFERESSNQIVVAVFRKMESESSVQDFTFRTYQAWQVGQKGRDNGAALFAFIDDRQMFLQVGYGLEGTLPDALAKRIIDDEIKPHFKAGRYDAGLAAGVDAILKATRGEYKGTGQTARDGRSRRDPEVWIIPIIVFFSLLRLVSVFRGGTSYSSGGRRRSGGWYVGSGGGGWSGSSSSGSSGGSFSGGGGRSGGGGAGGSW